MVKVEFGNLSEEEIKLSLLTTFGPVENKEHPPPSPGEEVGKDGDTVELLNALRRRLRESEKTIGKLRDEVSQLKADKDAGDEELRKSKRENEELRTQLAAASARGGKERMGFGFELEEQERLADHVAELEQERIVLNGMYRSATKRCQMLEQRLAARTQAALNMAIEGGMAPPVRIEPAADQSVNVPDGEEEGQEEEDEGLWDAPEQDETREDDRWRRGDWGDNVGGMESLGLRELTFNDLPLAQCRQLVTNSDNRLRVEDWVIRHACRCQQLGEYRHEPDLEGGGDDSASHCSSSTHGALLSVSSSPDSASALAVDDNKVAGGAQGSARKLRQPNSGNLLREELKAMDSMQVRVNRERFAAGGVTRAAWKTGSFATPKGSRREPVQGIFSSLLGGGVGSPAEKGISSVVQFAA